MTCIITLISVHITHILSFKKVSSLLRILEHWMQNTNADLTVLNLKEKRTLRLIQVI